MPALLEVEDLRVHFETEDGLVKAVDGISYTVDRGQTLGIVGESGSGKSVSSLTVMGLTRARNARISGKVRFDGKDLLGGAILTETVFNIQGIGRYAYVAITQSDLPVIQGTVLFGAFFIVIMNLIVDIIYAFLDPRVRY